MPAMNEKQPDQKRIVASLATKCHLPIGEMQRCTNASGPNLGWARTSPSTFISSQFAMSWTHCDSAISTRRPRRLEFKPRSPHDADPFAKARVLAAGPRPGAMSMPRRAVLGAAVCGALWPTLLACSSSASEQDAAQALRRPLAGGGDRAEHTRELVRYSTLAPSRHNRQSWTFSQQDQAIVIAPDLSRRCAPDQPRALPASRSTAIGPLLRRSRCPVAAHCLPAPPIGPP